MKRLLGTILLSSVAVLFLSFSSVNADLYIHNPRGSNNRYDEQNANRQNANRLFDSENNAAGGYAIGEANADGDTVVQPMYYFEESYLRIEWTQQHACGFNNKTFCQLVLQYTCNNDNEKHYNGRPWEVTDGEETGNNANPPTTGLNEPLDYYDKCEKRERNKGLYIADRNLNEDTATHTRQNENGNQYGTECPEERDYYPYWHPTPWKDIAVFTNSEEICPFYRTESQNVKPKGECECPDWDSSGCSNETPCWKHNNPTSCGQESGCQWVDKTTVTMFSNQNKNPAESNLSPPVCKTGGDDYWTRDNHLGNSKNGETPFYMWKLPTAAEACGNPNGCNQCFFRMRYNITTTDYHNLKEWQLPSDLEDKSNLDHYFWIDHRLNGDRTIKMTKNTTNYFENDPVVDMGVGRGLAIALNTAQTGRVFENRSHMFHIKGRPDDLKGKTIHNLNVRGKRGNIVQVYPAVEYDFAPKYLEVDEGDLIHVQWVGSNNNPNGNDGQGQAGTDRNNMMEFESLNHNFPKAVGDYTLFDPKDKNTILAFATSGKGTEADAQLNNASPYFDGYTAMDGKLLSPKPGTYYYGCTRNNNFTNRSQKGTIFVKAKAEKDD